MGSDLDWNRLELVEWLKCREDESRRLLSQAFGIAAVNAPIYTAHLHHQLTGNSNSAFRLDKRR